MSVGGDKVLAYDPPGAIGLVDPTAIVHLSFNENDSDTRPQDDAGGLLDLDPQAATSTLTMPVVMDAPLGRGRWFRPTTRTGLIAKDRAPTTLITRDVTIQVVLSWEAAAQAAAAGQKGTILSRGTSTSGLGVGYGLRLEVFDVPSSTATLRMFWSRSNGSEAPTPGVTVQIAAGRFTMLTATRRWISPTQVVLRYYVGDTLIGELTTVEGDVFGTLNDVTTVGVQASAGVFGNFYAGVIDALMVMPRELCAEEIECTWLRLTRYQPLGVRMYREQWDPGFPISQDIHSDAQKEIAMFGQVLGYCASRIENLRANFVPQRAYGTVLEDWEKAVEVTPQPVQGIDDRRARVLARLRQRKGVSIPGIQDALSDLIDADVSELEFIAYSNTIVDGFDTQIDPVLWDFVPAGAATWNAGTARMVLPVGSADMTGEVKNWKTIAQPICDPVTANPGSVLGRLGGESVFAKVMLQVPQNNLDAGVWAGNRATGTYILLGIRQAGGFLQVIGETFVNHVSVASVAIDAPFAGAPSALWLHLKQDDTMGGWVGQWSSVSPTQLGSIDGVGTFRTLIGSGVQPTADVVNWGGCYVRTIGSPLSAPATVAFDDFQVRMPNGTRPMSAYVFLDGSLGNPDLEGAHSVLQSIKHAYTEATIITSRAVLCDNPGSGCDRGPMGSP